MVREKRAVMKTNAGSIVAGFFVVALVGLSGCGEPVDKAASADGSNVAVVADFQKQLRTQLIMAKTGRLSPMAFRPMISRA